MERTPSRAWAHFCRQPHKYSSLENQLRSRPGASDPKPGRGSGPDLNSLGAAGPEQREGLTGEPRMGRVAQA